MADLTIELLEKAKAAMDVSRGPDRNVLCGPKWMVDEWRNIYGDSVEYVITEDIK